MSDIVFVVCMNTPPAFMPNVTSVMRSRAQAFRFANKEADELAKDCSAKRQGYPKQKKTFGREILRIEYAPDQFVTVEGHEVQ